ncbi:hypothetical protein BZK42_14275 [Citrobacter braakii]|uniref:Uncharacterized protein n=1 Tax=Citrobacter braakii TaxID=57706 RepID=A0A1V8NXM1_CITBR|nr:hypothetical protein BZK42_14275 [Citrobacter braakii]
MVNCFIRHPEEFYSSYFKLHVRWLSSFTPVTHGCALPGMPYVAAFLQLEYLEYIDRKKAKRRHPAFSGFLSGVFSVQANQNCISSVSFSASAASTFLIAASVSFCTSS